MDNKLMSLIAIVVIGCGVTTGPSPLDALDAEITALRECIPGLRQPCVAAGELLNPENPLDTAAVTWREVFVVDARSSWARWTSWRLEWPECRAGRRHCDSTPLTYRPLEENQFDRVLVVLVDNTPYWLIFVAELEKKVVADTIGFDAPNPFRFDSVPASSSVKSREQR